MKSIIFGLAAVAMTAAASAGSYGAIYFSPSNHATGYVTNAESRQDAVDIASAYCADNANDCVKGIEFWGGSCGAVAVGDRRGWGSGWGEEMDFANEAALAACAKNTTRCRVLKILCSSRH